MGPPTAAPTGPPNPGPTVPPKPAPGIAPHPTGNPTGGPFGLDTNHRDPLSGLDPSAPGTIWICSCGDNINSMKNNVDVSVTRRSKSYRIMKANI